MSTMVVDVRSRCSFLIIAVVFIGFVSSIQQTSKIYSDDSISAEHKQLIYRYWSHIEDVLALRKFEDTGIDVSDLPVGFHRELTKMIKFPTALHTSANVASHQCVLDSLFYVDNLLQKGSDWAIQMLETSGQLPASLVGSGHYHTEGLFDECQAIRSFPPRFKGKYCTVLFNLEFFNKSDNSVYAEPSVDPAKFETNQPILFLLQRLFGSSVNATKKVKPKLSSPQMKTSYINYPSLSICLPSSCSASDLGKSLAQLIGNYIIAGNQSIVTIADENLCFTDDRVLPPLDGPAITVILMCSLIILLVLLATAHEAWRNYNEISFVTETDSKIVSVLHCFSAISNGRKLLSFKPLFLKEDNITCLSGMRFICTCAVIAFHSSYKISNIGSNYLVNPKTFEEFSRYWMYLTSTDFTFLADTFFVISGVLVSYYLLKGLDYSSDGRLSLSRIYFQRYLRLTVVYGVVLAVVSTLLIYLDQGPNWYYLSLMSEKCRSNWWKHLFYINNFSQFDFNECFSDSWYLAVDFQLFLIAPIFVCLIWRWRKVGFIMLAAFTLGSLAANTIILAVYNLPQNAAGLSTMKHYNEGETINYMDLVYTKPWTRMSPYLIGILTGWMLYNLKPSKLKLSCESVSILWTVFFGLVFYVFFGTSLNIYFEKSFPAVDRIVRLTYGTLHRTAWALAVAWIILACSHDYGGYLNRFLSWKGFLPLSRLSFCAYLLQWNYLTVFFASQRRRLFFTPFNYLTTIFGFTVAIYGLAFFLALLVEIPCLSLIKLYPSLKSKPTVSTGTDNDNRDK